MGEILDKLKIAGYVTSTDPSDAIEQALDIHEGGGGGSFITTTPEDASVNLIWSVAKPGYIPQSGSLVLDDTTSLDITLTPISNYSSQPFTINVLSDGKVTINTSYWGCNGSAAWYSLNGMDKEYMVCNDNGYEHYNIYYLTHGSHYDLQLNVNAGDCIRIWGLNFSPNSEINYDYNDDSFIQSTANIEVCGNLLSLTLGSTFTDLTHFTMGSQQFFKLFESNSHLTSAQNLILPSIETEDGCYKSMFEGCTSLTTAPELPALSLNGECYASMFKGCTSLTTAPELLAPTLGTGSNTGCYAEMFYGCSNLNYIKCFAAVDMYSSGSLSNWVYGVAANGTFIKLDQTDWPVGSSGIPTGWTVRNDNDHEFIIAPTPADATVIIDGETRDSIWTKTGSSITWSVCKPGYIPQTGTYTMTNQDYTMNVSLTASADNYTFTINPTPADAIVTINDVSTSSVTVPVGTLISWSVSKEGYTTQSGSLIITENITESVVLEETPGWDAMPLTFKMLGDGSVTINHPGSTGWTGNESEGWYKINDGNWIRITDRTTINVQENDTIQFKGLHWNEENASSAASLLEDSDIDHEVYGNVLSITLGDNFVGVTPQLADFQFMGLFEHDTYLTSAEHLVLPAVNLSAGCYSEMFKQCTSLTIGPDLLAESLNNGTEYDSMFYGCSSLNYIKCLLTGSNISCSQWTYDVAANGTFVKSANASWETGYDGIPYGWTVETV